MSETPEAFLDFLNATRPTNEQILVALHYYLSEVTGDKLPREMREELEARAKGQNVGEAIDSLSQNRRLQVAGALTYFAQEWEDAEERPRIQRAFAAAGVKLPIIETGLIAVMTMYAMFLVATGGRKIAAGRSSAAMMEPTRRARRKRCGDRRDRCRRWCRCSRGGRLQPGRANRRSLQGWERRRR